MWHESIGFSRPYLVLVTEQAFRLFAPISCRSAHAWPGPAFSFLRPPKVNDRPAMSSSGAQAPYPLNIYHNGMIFNEHIPMTRKRIKRSKTVTDVLEEGLQKKKTSVENVNNLWVVLRISIKSLEEKEKEKPLIKEIICHGKGKRTNLHHFHSYSSVSLPYLVTFPISILTIVWWLHIAGWNPGAITLLIAHNIHFFPLRDTHFALKEKRWRDHTLFR